MNNQEMNALVLLAQQGDEEAKTIVIKSVWKLVDRVVYALNEGRYDEDLTSIGLMGVLKAIDTFDTTKDSKFSTHAYWKIRGEISHEFAHRSRKKREINSKTVLFSTPIFGEESEDKTLEEILGGDTSEYNHIFEEKTIWWAYTQLNDSDKKLFYYKYVKQQTREELRVTMGFNTLSNLRRREALLKQRLNTLLDNKYATPQTW